MNLPPRLTTDEVLKLQERGDRAVLCVGVVFVILAVALYWVYCVMP